AGALQGQQHLAHRSVVGVRRLLRRFGVIGDAGIDLREIGRRRDGRLATHRDGRRKIIGERGRCQQRGGENRGDEGGKLLHLSHFSGTNTLITSLSSAVLSGS